MAARQDVVIGGYYERPDGAVARTCGWDPVDRSVSYALDDGNGVRKVGEDVLATTWKRRADLRDFPNARDPVLPYAFDLLWDAKTRSALLPLLADPETAADVREAMEHHGIALTRAESEALEDLCAEVTAPRF